MATAQPQEIKKRKGAAIDPSAEKNELSTSKNSIVNNKPDYAIKVLCKIDGKTGKSDLEAHANLKILIRILQLNGFHIDMVPDTNNNYVILLVTINDKLFEQLVDLSIQNDKLFNVNFNNINKISIAERLRLIYYKLTLPKEKGGCEIEIGLNNVVDMIPCKNLLNLENEFNLNKKQIGKLFNKNIRKQNTQFLKENFGIKYAMYYKFVQGYVSSIGFLSLFGILAWYFLGNFSKIYTLINIFFGLTTYLCIYSSELHLRNEWNLNNISKTEILILNEDEIIPNWQILLRKYSFIPITIISAISLFIGQFSCFLLEIFINEIYQGPFKSILSLLPTIMVSLIVPIFTMIYSIICNQYLKFEKNITNEKYDKSLLEKMFIFNCLASYSPLIITSFIYLPLGYILNPYLQSIKTTISNFTNSYSYLPNIPILESKYKVNNLRMNTQIFYFMVTNQIVGTFLEFGLPLIINKIKNIEFISNLLGVPKNTKKLKEENKGDKEEIKYLQLIKNNFNKPIFNIDDDYRQHILQYGFQMLFGPIWPLSSLICFIFGIIQQEGDYLKYIKMSKNVLPNRNESIKPWIIFMKILLIIGSFISTSISLMYNNKSGIESFVGYSSVNNSWIKVIIGSFTTSLILIIIIYCSEEIIKSIYENDNNKEDIEKEIEISKIYLNHCKMIKKVDKEIEGEEVVENFLKKLEEFQSN